MKPLIPSHREKKRYLLVKCDKCKSIKEIKQKVKKSIEEFLGILGMTKTSLRFIESGFFKKEKFYWVIICINKEMLDKVRASFCVFKNQNISVINVSGTLKKLRNKIENKE